MNILNKWINNKSNLYTDCWKGYLSASNSVAKHETVNHSLKFVSCEGIHTNTIEGNWTGIKQLIPKRYRNKKNLSKWLYYAMFLRNFKENSLNNFIKYIK
ncbi:hypothetical protein GVAV_003245 [Gurleya vavrai]